MDELPIAKNNEQIKKPIIITIDLNTKKIINKKYLYFALP